MPEGPEIRRAARQVAEAIAGKRATRVWFGLPRLKRWEKRLTGQRILGVESRGKAMLTRFASGECIYSHNQLYGRWRCASPGDNPDTRRQLRLVIETRDRQALLYSASDIEVLEDGQIETHPYLARLGPDVLDPETTEASVLERLLLPAHRQRRLGNFLAEQSFVAGLGNYLRCEILHASGLSPTAKPAELSREQLERLAANILAMPRQSFETSGITNELPRAQALLADGATFEEARFRVFRREGQPCYTCGAEILKVRNAGQACYLCPECQQRRSDCR